MIQSTLASLPSIIQNVFFILFGCIGMGFLIGFHELGHFMFAKLFHVRTPSFSIGFGPKLISKKIGETEFSLSAIPFGGYVEIAGAAEVGQGEQKESHATDEASFAKKPYYQKLLIMLGGILFNLAFAYCALIILCLTGIPKTPLIQKTLIAHIAPDSAAEKYGISIGDHIIAVNGTPLEDSVVTLQSIITPLASQQVAITLKRNGVLEETSVVLGEKIIREQKVGTLGVEFEISPTPAIPFIEAVWKGIAMTNTWIKNTITGFMHIRKNHGEMAGPVMIIAMTTRAAASGFKILLLLLAIISINLAILNLIPLPILDGGQILFYIVQRRLQKLFRIFS